MEVTETDWVLRFPLRVRAAAGDEEACAELFSWLWPWTIQRARSDDAAGVGWLKVVRRPSLWLKSLGFFALIFINAGRDWRKAERRRVWREAEAFRRARLSIPAPSAARRRAMLMEALSKLSREHQALMTIYFEGYSLEEMATITGVSESALRRHLTTAREALRRALGEER